MNDKLKHLTEEEINEVIFFYEEGNLKVKEIVEEYNIDISSASSLITILPLVKTEEICEICGGNLLRKIKRRSEVFPSKERECSSCKHVTNSYLPCNCEKCKKIRAEKLMIEKMELDRIKQKKYDLMDSYSQNIEKVDESYLSLKSLINLGVLLRYCISEDYQYIKPFEKKEFPMTPYIERDRDIYHDLIDNRIIIPIADKNLLDSVNLTGEDKSNFVFNFYKMKYSLNIYSKSTKFELIEQFISPNTDRITKEYYPYALELWRGVAKEEVREYLIVTLEKLRIFDIKIGEKTDRILAKLVKSFSTNKIHYIIWKVKKDVTDKAYEYRIKQEKMFDLLISGIENYSERIIANKWEINCKFNRSTPQSMLSKLMFNHILKIGDSGFNEIPNQDTIDRRYYESLGFDVPDDLNDETLFLGEKIEF